MLHRTAYASLGIDWDYEAIDVAEAELSGFLTSRDESWRGLSLTMPLKREVVPLLDERDPFVELTGVANTVLFERGRMRGFNTDVYGLQQALGEIGVTEVNRAWVLGGGATAASALVALHRMGAAHAEVSVRTPARAEPLTALGRALGVDVMITRLGETAPDVDVVVSTLPNAAHVDLAVPPSVPGKAVLLDVAYEPWPTGIASAWLQAGGKVVPGLAMLVHQAVAQVRIFVGGSAEVPLERETEILAKMRASVDLG